jgi:hypothetical protein
MNRRAMLTGTSALALLTACQTGASTQTQLQTDAALVTAGVAAVAVSVLATPNLAPETKDKINQAVATVNAANQVIQQATQTVGTNAQQLVVAIKIAAPLILAVLAPTSAEAIAINAALSLLPTILAAAGLPPSPAAAMAPGKAMDPAQAVLVLKGYTGK